jgi:hypothetical protein
MEANIQAHAVHEPAEVITKRRKKHRSADRKDKKGIPISFSNQASPQLLI